MTIDLPTVLLLCAILALLAVLVWRMREGTSWALGLSCILAISLFHQMMYRTIAEDAYIAFRYARNMASGQGLVFNPGERVEGYSDFLWTASLGLVHRLFGLKIPITASVLGVVFTLAAIILTWRLAMKLTDSTGLAGAASLLVAGSSSFSAYGPSGLEGPLFTVFILLTFLTILVDRLFIAGLMIALATMTRPDGILLVLPLAAYIALMPGISWMERGKKIAVAAAGAVLLAAPWTAWRISYYGYLIPNALEAKRGMNFAHQVGNGIYYVARFVFVHLPIFAGILLLAKPAIRRMDRRDRTTITAAVMGMFSIIYIAFILLAGGDWMPGYRFLAPIVPALAILLVWLCSLVPMVRGTMTSWRGIGAVSAASVFMVAAALVILIPKFRVWDQATIGLGEIGVWLNTSVPKDVTTACFACGALPYYSELPTLDMLGLCDEHISRHGLRKPFGAPGHIAYDYDYVVSRKPAIVAFLSGNGFEPRPESPVDTRSQRWRDYEVVSFRFLHSRNWHGEYVTLLILRSEKDRLAPSLVRPNEIELVPGPIKVSPEPVA